MKLWLLRPAKGNKLWEPWYDKAFGFVIRAETEEDAREIAQSDNGEEINFWVNNKYYELPAWTSAEHSTCEELLADGEEGIIIKDFRRA